LNPWRNEWTPATHREVLDTVQWANYGAPT
jgi:hypothetical protein